MSTLAVGTRTQQVQDRLMEAQMPTYTYDHIHLRSRNPMETARYFNKMFDAEILESVQSDGQPRGGRGHQRSNYLHRPRR